MEVTTMRLREKLIKKTLLDLAEENTRGYKFSAFLADEHDIVWAVNEVTSTGDPTAHAEVQAIRRAAGRIDYSRATLYSSHEPCPMCLVAAAWAGIKQIVYIKDFTEADENNDYYDQPANRVNKLLNLKRNIRRMK
jgi:guanine deaminase